jgi:6,7-dimethyl-8-ribityllumazine synthase
MKSAPNPLTAYDAAPADSHFAIVCSRWNAQVTDGLLEAALATLRRAAVTDDRITVARVPGAFELPVVANRLAQSGRFAAVICLGAVIKGETEHDRYINESVAHALQNIGIETNVPVLFGLLTCTTEQQALDRAGGAKGNKGTEAAEAAIEMTVLLRRLAGEGL